jgi:peptidoglycan LD-endopeptidase CwlK
MPDLDKRSIKLLGECHPILVEFVYAFVNRYPIRITEAARLDRKAQEEHFKAGRSKARFGESPHNYNPSLAVHLIPTHIEWSSVLSFMQNMKANKPISKFDSKTMFEWSLMIGVGLGISKERGISVVSGVDWDGDWDLHDTKLDDWGHWEVYNWRQYR